MRILLSFLALIFNAYFSFAQEITFAGQAFTASNVKAAVVDFEGQKVLRVERDLQKLPFDADRLEATVDEPTFVKLGGTDFENGTIEVKMLSQIQNPSPFARAQGFIGIAFRIHAENTAFESIYLRPKIGRSDNQMARNRTVQYFAYPDHKFEKLRTEYPAKYETTAPVGLNEWITMRIEIQGEMAKMFINDAQYATFVVDKMLGKTTHGGIGLWVDIGTIGYFKDLKVTPAQEPAAQVPQMIRAFQPPNVVNKTPYGAVAHAGQYVQAADAKIYYEVYGKGQPIVLLHGGLFGSIVEMSDFIDQLKGDHQVIAINTRGHGLSSLGTEPLTLPQRANDAMAVINAVTQDSVTIIGFSDGGYTAYQLAAMYPHRVKKMVVMGAGELWPGARVFNFTAEQAKQFDPAFMAQHARLNPEPQRIEEMFSQVAACYNKVTVGKEILGAISCPVLVMAGDHDDGNPVERVLSAARKIPQHQISIIPNTGHGCFLENFEAVWAVVRPFVQ
jgi:pimeloyl-ACP methyl ester carboxylesterase